jgi:two-component system alkaline phosphatase synthesis response regulator PhoP
MTIKILIVDDEPAILQLVSAYLVPEGYGVITALDGVAGLRMILSEKPDIVVLDVMLPGMDGIEILSRIRRESNVYVILLTAKTEETDKVVGLSVGADDYVTKPFSPKELVARIKSAIRRLNSKPTIEEKLTFGNLQIDILSHIVTYQEKIIDLTAIEFSLLVVLAENPGRVYTREQLLEKVWGATYFGEIRVVDVHLGHVRQKIGGQYITTVRGVGFRFEP